MPNIEYELNEKIHAIIINPYLTWDDFCTNCDLIKKYNLKNISTSLNYLAYFKHYLGNYDANINALISYPLADLPVSFIEEFVYFAKDKGANGIEYIPNFISLSKRNLETFAAEIEQVKLSGLPVTIIINKLKLQEEILYNAIEISLELGIKNFQFGDGFGSPISSNDVADILKLIGNQNQIKIVGGIKKLVQVIDLFDAGINCVGTSNFCEIFQEIKGI
ncbi:2-deoxyribose-5-phosphate aldolase [Prochlorococcus marinus str. MU1404]|uniref:2-deoxyribose-5-phosphate aldolase n=1 Tax=Prochlorococcus marinus TaxID=1219 RepID=UPI001ADA461B|nr:2-deoxyribose-5-phosphate aldolase [Prochlorococcus marinus]MBO8229598.1 2-deoxyribose-5-phosphate aldolase [Prochlorococcus marinus XMU1404]MBW3072675.1 2-deoxyribose-5-phosphate aldolase [Prochlorococcus marinus str. MU1404]MCR8546067.1 2-deoxyribose-5-phosphate aldolase [Prochlorococcus marinus CUG1432]